MYGIFDFIYPFNRTILELKLRIYVVVIRINKTFNRTILELKFPSMSSKWLFYYSFNRTILELKLNNMAYVIKKKIDF